MKLSSSSLNFSFVSSDLLLNCSNESFISFIILFNYRSSIQLHIRSVYSMCNICVFGSSLYLIRHCHITICYSSSISCFDSVTVLGVTAWGPLSVEENTGPITAVFVTCFFSGVWPTSLFFVCCILSVLKTNVLGNVLWQLWIPTPHSSEACLCLFLSPHGCG